MGVSAGPQLTSLFLMDGMLEAKGSIFIVCHPSTLSAAAESCLCSGFPHDMAFPFVHWVWTNHVPM